MLNCRKFAGIDVGRKSIKVVQVEKCKNQWCVKNFWSVKRSENLLAAFNSIKGDLRKYKAVIGIPNDRALYRKTELPQMKSRELRQAIFWEKRELLKELGGEYVADYEITKATDRTFDILMAAVPKNDVMDYLYLAKESGVALEAIDVYPLAISRVFTSLFPEKNFAVVDIGAVRTEITLFYRGRVDFSHSVLLGGDDMTSLLAKFFSIDESEAESIKIYSGDYRDKVKRCLVPLLDHLTLQIVNCIKHFRQINGEEVETVVFTGGGGKLSGLREYFFNQTKIETFLADELDFPHIKIDRGFDKMEFSCALGYALKGAF